MDRRVEAVFFDKDLKRMIDGFVRVPAGGSGLSHAAKLACADYAFDNGYTHWAHHDPVEKRWMIFTARGRSSRSYLGDSPTKEAASMWLVHCV